MLFRSIKWQLLLWQTLLLAVVLLTLMTLHYQLHKKDLIAAVDAELQQTLLNVMPAVASPRRDNKRTPPHLRVERAALLNIERPIEREAVDLLAELEEKGMYLIVKNWEGINYYGLDEGPSYGAFPRLASTPICITRDGKRELLYPHHDMQIVMGESIDHVYAEMNLLFFRLLLVGASVLVFGVVIGWGVVSRALRPIKQISCTAETIRSGAHDQRIELTKAPEELASLANTLNCSFDHLDEAIETQKRFALDASHELRTPLAVIIAQCQAALKKERQADEYKGVLKACLRAGERMRLMANTLLELAQIDEHEIDLHFGRCNLNELLAQACDDAEKLSVRHSVSYQKSASPLFVHVDRNCIHQLIMNLLSNAITHNPDGCDINVGQSCYRQTAIITVADSGVGIPSESIPHLFDRFYRVDSSRSRKQGGSGLGLSIVKQLVEIHHGTIEVKSTLGVGSTFIIQLPLNQPDDE